MKSEREKVANAVEGGKAKEKRAQLGFLSNCCSPFEGFHQGEMDAAQGMRKRDPIK